MSQFANRLSRVLLPFLVAVVALGSQFAAALEVGDKAPDFVDLNEFGQSTSLSDFLGICSSFVTSRSIFWY